jgi:hypothetical protein
VEATPSLSDLKVPGLSNQEIFAKHQVYKLHHDKQRYIHTYKINIEPQVPLQFQAVNKQKFFMVAKKFFNQVFTK